MVVQAIHIVTGGRRQGRGSTRDSAEHWEGDHDGAEDGMLANAASTPSMSNSLRATMEPRLKSHLD